MEDNTENKNEIPNPKPVSNRMLGPRTDSAQLRQNDRIIRQAGSEASSVKRLTFATRIVIEARNRSVVTKTAPKTTFGLSSNKRIGDQVPQLRSGIASHSNGCTT